MSLHESVEIYLIFFLVLMCEIELERQKYLFLLSEQRRHSEHCAYIYCNVFRPFISVIFREKLQ